MNLASIHDAASIIRQGGVVAYPTESCYGLGCDLGNSWAVRRILHIKRRNKEQGLIVVADHLARVMRYVEFIPVATRQEILASWPGPHTWLLPARKSVSNWIVGNHASIAIRISRHHGVRMLCRSAGMAIISTSANRARRKALRTAESVHLELGGDVDCIVEGEIGADTTPSVIRDAISGAIIRG